MTISDVLTRVFRWEGNVNECALHFKEVGEAADLIKGKTWHTHRVARSRLYPCIHASIHSSLGSTLI